MQPLISFIFGSFVFICILAAIYILFITVQERHVFLKRATEASTLGKEAFMRLFALGGLPFWLKDPSSNSCNWMNDVFSQIWPKIDRSLTSWAFKDNALENLLNEETFWKPEFMKHCGVVLHHISLGDAPVTISALKVVQTPYNGSSDALILDISFDWASKMAVQLSMKALDDKTSIIQSRFASLLNTLFSVLFRTITVKVLIRQLIARGTVRVIAAPLLNTLPVIGAVRLSFLEPPAITYQLHSFGANALLVPGLESWLNSFISNQILKPFVFPEGFVLDIGQLFLGTRSQILGRGSGLVPEGLMRVTLHKAVNVPRMDLFGLCDPYIKIYLTQKQFKQRTTVKANTLSPNWEEEFQFIVFSAAHQILHIELWDSDVFSRDDLIGIADIPIKNLNLIPGKEERIHVVIPPVASKYKSPKKKEEGNAEARPLNGNGSSNSTTAHHHVFEQQHRDQRPKQNVFTEMFSKKECTVDLSIQYFPFNIQDTKQALRSLPLFSGDTAPPVPSSLSVPSIPSQEEQQEQSQIPPRIQQILAGGLLHIKLLRAIGLPSHSATYNKRFIVSIAIYRRSERGQPRYKKKAERGGRGLNSRSPFFDQSVDFFIDGDVAQAADTVVDVQIWSHHFIRKPSYKGGVAIELQRVLQNERVSDVWKMDEGGEIEMDLEWQGMMKHVFVP